MKFCAVYDLQRIHNAPRLMLNHYKRGTPNEILKANEILKNKFWIIEDKNPK